MLMEKVVCSLLCFPRLGPDWDLVLCLGLHTYSVDARELLAQLQHHCDEQRLPVGAAAQELEQGHWTLSLQLPFLILQLCQCVRHISPACQAL